MKMRKITTTSLLVIASYIGIVCGIDPCVTNTEIRDKFRSADYFVKDVPYERLLCDYGKFDGSVWYKFHNGASLTNTCVKTYHCGTHLPMWMRGTPPSAGVEADMEICSPSGDDSNCCDQRQTIKVKNCGTFMVYQLQSPPGCSMSYCAGTGVPCPPDKWSATGFEPNCQDMVPKMLQSPTLSKPILKSNTFEFHCDVNFDPTRKDVRFDVIWMFDNKTDPAVPHIPLMGSDRTAVLDGSYLQGHMQQEVSCKVSAMYTNNPMHIKGPYVPSNTYWAGIKMSNTSITASEKGSSQKVDIISTVPIVCPQHTAHICHLDIRLDSNNHDITAARKCTYRLDNTNWNPTTGETKTTIEIQAKRDFQKDGDKNLELHFQPLFTADGPKIFQHVNISYLHVRSQDEKTSTCICFGDPHCKTFDRLNNWRNDYYDYYKLGEFMMYENTLDKGSPSQVQVRTWSCGKVTCMCGVAAREGNDLVVIDMCQGHYGKSFPQVYPPHQTVSHGAAVTQDKSGNTYVIEFPSGLQVKVVNHGNKVFTVDITVPPDVQQKSGGLCGYFDDNKDNDMKHSDGKIENFQRDGNSFAESWRIPPTTSLFDHKETLVENHLYNPDIYYCNCDQTTGNPDCKIDNNVKTPAVHDVCANCNVPVMTKPTQNKGRRRRSTYDNADYAPMFYLFEYGLGYSSVERNFPTENGKTQADAEKACKDAFDNNPTIQQCITEAGIDFSPEIETCVEDFKYFDDGSFVAPAVSDAIDVCRFTVLPEVKFYKNGKPPAYITTDLCPSHCSGHGVCNTGTCTCHHGYAGDGCEINTLVPPALYNVVSSYKDSIVCDITRRPCNLMFVAGTNMMNSSRLTCKVEVSTFDGSRFVSTGQNFTTGTIYNNMYHVGCKLPTKSMVNGHTIVKYTLSISNDGKQYSNSVNMVKTDPACIDCSQDGVHCYIKDNTCLIDGNCHTNGDTHTGNLVCDPSKDRTKWTSTTTQPTVTPAPGSTRPVAPLGGYPMTRFDIWTSSKTGCPCAHDPTLKTCACCDVDGCQCPAPNEFQCVQCGDTASCGTPKPGPMFGLDGYTLALNDCDCEFDSTRFGCACCNENVGACQCGAEHKNQCVNCNHMDQCGNKPWIFGPAFTK